MSDKISRRAVLKRGAQTAAIGAVVGTAGTASASTECETGDCTGIIGDVLIIEESYGTSAEYLIDMGTHAQGRIFNCFDSTLEDSRDRVDDWNGYVDGEVNGGRDKYLISGGEPSTITLRSNGKASVSVDVQFCPDHCFTPNYDRADFTVRDPESEADESEYYVSKTVDIDEDEYQSSLENDDGEQWGSTCTGTVSNGDKDHWGGQGRLSTFSAVLNGTEIEYSSDALSRSECIGE